MGAPLDRFIVQTVLCACHLALLAVHPLLYVHGVSSDQWRSIIALELPQDEVLGAAIGTVVGAWFGAFPIPLDW